MKSWHFIGLALVLPVVWFVCQDATQLQIGSPAFAQSSQIGSDAEGRLNEKIDRYEKQNEKFERQTSQQITYITIGNFASIVVAIIGLFGSWLTWRVNWRVGVAQREQERDLAREKHTMELVRDLGNEKLTVRIAAITLLFDRIGKIENEPNKKRMKQLIHEQGRLLQALVSVTKESSADRDLAKMIGDELVRVVKAEIKEGTPSARSVSPLHTFRGEKLDLQKVKFPDVYWRKVDGRGVDFYASDFTKAGLREAFLHKAIFYGASLKECVLRDADLTEANFQGADLSGADLRGAKLQKALLVGTNFTGANLTGANLKGAKADATTIWPDGFDYKGAL